MSRTVSWALLAATVALAGAPAPFAVRWGFFDAASRVSGYDGALALFGESGPFVEVGTTDVLVDLDPDGSWAGGLAMPEPGPGGAARGEVVVPLAGTWRADGGAFRLELDDDSIRRFADMVAAGFAGEGTPLAPFTREVRLDLVLHDIRVALPVAPAPGPAPRGHGGVGSRARLDALLELVGTRTVVVPGALPCDARLIELPLELRCLLTGAGIPSRG